MRTPDATISGTPYRIAVLSLGLPGLLRRVRNTKRDENDAEGKCFDEAEETVYSAAFEYLDCCAAALEKAGKAEAASGVLALKKRPPETLFEAIQLIFVYYALQHTAEGTNLRSLGRLDSLLYPFYISDINSGRMTKEKAYDLFSAFMKEAGSYHFSANLPFVLGGTKPQGGTAINELSEIILRALIDVASPFVKTQILYGESTPDSFLKTALNGVRQGKNSMVFICDHTVKSGLKRLGCETHDIERYGIVGCYEACAYGGNASTCNGRVSLSKAIEATLTGGYDLLTGERIGTTSLPEKPENFEDFYRNFEAQLSYFCHASIALTNEDEKHYDVLHASPFYSSTYEKTVLRGRDIYTGYGAGYNNSSINVFSIGSASDSLAAIRKAVYEDKILTLEEFIEILKNDWKGNEELLTLIKNKYPKYGNGDKSTDSLAARIVESTAKFINGVPNVKGGVYRLGLFSIDWRNPFGQLCGASPDGRRAFSPLSKNSTPSLGADRNGISAEILSFTSIDASLTPNGHTHDAILHASSVEREAGLDAMLAILRAFDTLGGFAMHINVLDANVLRDAKKFPEKYPNLQVRLCGWNVLFSTLDESEQDEFIQRTEALV